MKETAKERRDRMSHALNLEAPGWDGGIRLDLPLPPSVNALWRRSRYATYLSPSYRKWMVSADTQLEAQRATLPYTRIDGPFNVAALLPVQRMHSFDLDNRIKATLDWAEKAGLVVNDKFNRLLHLEWGPVTQGIRVWMVPVSD